MPTESYYEPVGRFSDLPRERIKVTDRPIYTLRLRPEPGVDHTRAMRWALKVALRQYGFRCVDISREPPLGTSGAAARPSRVK